MRTVLLTLGLLVLSVCGCKTVSQWGAGKTAPPTVFATTPTLDQLKTEINQRAEKIRSFSSDSAVISASSSSVPLRSCSIALERPRSMRIKGGAMIGLGTEIDFGSNDELFWFWAKRNQEKEIYYAKHDQFASCPTRNVIPVEPDWLFESFGIVELKETDQHSGPTRSADGNLQITSQLNTRQGIYTRIITVHPQTGVLLKHEIYSPGGQPLVASVLQNYTVDAGSGIPYAKKIEVHCPAANEILTFNLSDAKYNVPGGFSSTAFSMPSYEGYIPTDICGPDFQQRPHPAGLPASPYPNQIATQPQPGQYGIPNQPVPPGNVIPNTYTNQSYRPAEPYPSGSTASAETVIRSGPRY